ncbi:geranylgeranyl transferase type2 beta subunit, putative [Hepatocystis sp. ex Piliocolobus tephrosceles]|nr:geranylgeranyl transferase type2 beta subunit, putative [Hepatocystis sp. ex Piliocolobus tephrosceles]
MELHSKLHEQYFLNIINKKLTNKFSSNEESNKYDSVFLSGIFWVLCGLTIINKERKSLHDILEKNVIDSIYILVMQCLQSRKINKKYIYKFKKEKYFLSNKDIHNIIKNAKCNNGKNLNTKSFVKIYEKKNNIILYNTINDCDLQDKQDVNEKYIHKKVKCEKSNNSCSCCKKIDNTYMKKKCLKNKNIDKYVKEDINNILSNLSNSFKIVCVEKFSKRREKFIIKGFSPCNKKWLYEANVLTTLSAIQILFLINKISETDISTKTLLHIYNFIYFLFEEKKGFFHFSLNNCLYNFDGDMRFMFCSLSILYFIKILLKKRNININIIYTNKKKKVNWILSCFNLDGGFANVPGAESHAGTTFCAINSLNLLTDKKNNNYYFSHNTNNNTFIKKKLIRWLCDRYDNSGINGRVGKDSDVCYAWWVLGSLVALKSNLSKLFNINTIINFILSCQDKKHGGFSRVKQCELSYMEKNNFVYNDQNNLTCKQTDPFHTFFSLCALSLIYYNILYHKKKEKKKKKYELFDDTTITYKYVENILYGLQNVHQSFAMPVHMTL